MIKAVKYGSHYIWNNQMLKRSMKKGKCLVKPSQIYIIWTGLCNFSCPMCKIQEWEEKLPTDVVKDVIDQMASWGVPKLTIAGGEPLLFRDEFLDILEHANRRGILVHFSTNGTNFDEAFLGEYSKIGGGQVTVSLDGATAKTHNLMRNHDRAYEIAMGAIETYRRRKPGNVIFKVQPVLTSENIDEIADIFEIARQADALFSVQAYDPMDFDILRKEVPLSEIGAKYPLWIAEENFPRLEKMIQSLLEMKKQYPGAILNTGENLRDIILYFRRELDLAGRCLVGYTSLFIVPDGQVTMCLYGNIGNIKDAPLRELWLSDRFEGIRNNMAQCDRPCLNGCAQRFTTGKVLYEGFHYMKRRLFD